MFDLRGAGLCVLTFSLALCATAKAATPETLSPGDPAAAQRAPLPQAAEVELALSAAPQHLRAGARVLVYGPAGFREVRAGAGAITCLVNRDSFFYGAATLKPTCWDRNGEESYLPVMLRVGELLAKGASAKAIEDDIEAGFADGRFRSPSRAGVAYMLAGDLLVDPKSGAVQRQAFPGHYMIYAVGVGNEDIGYSKDGAAATPSLPFVFARGAGGAKLGYIISGHDHPH